MIWGLPQGGQQGSSPLLDASVAPLTVDSVADGLLARHVWRAILSGRQRQVGDRSTHPMHRRSMPSAPTKSSSVTSPASAAAAADTPQGTAASAMRRCTGRPSIRTAPASTGPAVVRIANAAVVIRRHPRRPVILRGGKGGHISDATPFGVRRLAMDGSSQCEIAIRQTNGSTVPFVNACVVVNNCL
jgi:hypothetical protein